MSDSISYMVEFVKDHIIVKDCYKYQLFTTLDNDIITDLEQNGIIVTQIDKSQNLYIGRVSNEFINILKKHKNYQLFTLENKQFLELATYFIHHNFRVLDASFMGCRLIQLEVEKNVVNMTLFASGMIDSNVNPTNYIRSFFESASYDKNKAYIQQT